jgi:hypothetical protein
MKHATHEGSLASLLTQWKEVPWMMGIMVPQALLFLVLYTAVNTTNS